MRLVCISDLHNNFMRSLPVGDVLLIAGDFTSRGKVDEIEKFNAFLGRFKPYFKEIIISPGNHDFLFEEDFPRAKSLITNAKLLMNETHELYNGMTIFGSPVISPIWGAFQVATDNERKLVWNSIPSNIDILLTHTPSFGVLDRTDSGINCGCKALTSRLKELDRLRLHVVGHIHESHGIMDKSDSKPYIAVNASICKHPISKGLYEPIVVELGD